jgi:hypothetical protein
MSEDQDLTAITSRFPTYTLDEDLFLFDRRDTKYLFLAEDLYSILRLLNNHYNILKVNDRNYSHYRTTYFDTSDYNLYKAHHNGKLNRYKVRVRNYLDSEMIYLEVKFKSNKRRTIKKRILTEDIDHLSREDYLFLKTAIPYDPYSLFPSLMTEYIRLTLLNYEHQEKVTIDFDLKFHHLKNGKEAGIPKIGIIETKNERGRNHSLLSKILSDDLIQYQRVSKYCLGMSMLDSTIKKNLYKPKLLFIDHM